jgi:hypothetical protein
MMLFSKTTCTNAEEEEEEDDDAGSYLQMFNNIRMDSQNHLLGNLCHLQHNNSIVIDDALNKRGARQSHCKDFAVMTRCCSVKTNSCTHAEEEEEEEEEEDAGCLPSLRAASPASKNSSVMEDREEKSSIFLLLPLGHPHSSPRCPALLSLFSLLGCSMFLFTSLIPPLESILSHSELGASAATAAAGGVAAAGGGATAAAAASALLSLEESEEFGGGSCTSDLPSRLLKLST